MYYPVTRLRRLRRTAVLREMLRENAPDIKSLIYPLFVIDGKDKKETVKSMPGVFRLSVDNILKELKEVQSLQIPAVILFGCPDKKDERASEAYKKNGLVQTAIKQIKEKFPELIVITDVCLCGYTVSGHCGIIRAAVAGENQNHAGSTKKAEVEVNNDLSCELLAKMALSHAEAGADMVAPSSMMDGQVSSIRGSLDSNNFKHIPVMAYSAKYASSFYGPFRDAAGSAPGFGDRKSYQMNPANSAEAMREIELDIQEGADIVMVKPGLAYLDIVRQAKDKFNIPLAVYNVSGEYSMVKAAAAQKLVDERLITMEILTSMKRAGADLIITYHAKEAARWLSGEYLI